MAALLNSRALLLTGILGVTFWCAFLVRTEESELKQSEEALRHVTSWRQKMITTSGTGREVEIFCSGQEPTPNMSEGIPKTIISCNGLEQGKSVYPLPQLDSSFAKSIFANSHIEAVDGIQCQEWTTASGIAGRYVQPWSTNVEEVCIGIKDHLPRRVKYRDVEYIFSDWKLHTTR